MHPDTLLELSKKSIEGSGSNVVFGLIDHNLVTSFQFSPTFNVNFELLRGVQGLFRWHTHNQFKPMHPPPLRRPCQIWLLGHQMVSQLLC